VGKGFMISWLPREKIYVLMNGKILIQMALTSKSGKENGNIGFL